MNMSGETPRENLTLSEADLAACRPIVGEGGQVLRALGRSDDAVAAFRAAMATWPGAQSARVALMTLLLNRGDREGAGALAEAAQASPGDDFDPWWTYWLGDYRGYPVILDRLRAFAR